MERRDILVIVCALAVVLILALVVKPMLTGKAVDLGLPETPAPTVPVESVPPSVPSEIISAISTPTPEPTITGSNAPSGNSGSETGSGSVLPSPTAVSWQPDPENPMPAVQMVEYADIVGKYTGSTAPFRIPTPYWEVAYNVTPSGSDPVFLMDVVEKGDVGSEDKTIRSYVYRTGKLPDPKEGRFFEGGRDYYLKITADQLEKYRVIISIPLKYIPDN